MNIMKRWKSKAVQFYQSQLQPFPNERSVEAVKALAVHSGAAAGFKAAESFILVRDLYETNKINFL